MRTPESGMFVSSLRSTFEYDWMPSSHVAHLCCHALLAQAAAEGGDAAVADGPDKRGGQAHCIERTVLHGHHPAGSEVAQTS